MVSTNKYTLFDWILDGGEGIHDSIEIFGFILFRLNQYTEKFIVL